MAVALVAVQLGVDAETVADAAALAAALDRAVATALAGAGAADHRLVVLPEGLGLLALVALAPPRAREATTLAQLLTRAAVRRPLAVLRGALDALTLEPRHAALVGLVPDLERWIGATIARLARRHRAIVVGGSHLRLDARGEVVAASNVFDADGRLLGTVDKINLLAGYEDRTRGGLGLARGDVDRLPRLGTPIGPIAVLIGYDAFAAPDSPHERFVALGPRLAARGGVAVIANPAASPWRWDAPVGAGDERAADRWARRGLAATMAGGAVARWGVTAHVVGRLLDLELAGESQIIRDDAGRVDVVARATGADRPAAVTWVARELGEPDAAR